MLNILPMEEHHLEAVEAIERACFSLPWSIDAFREELNAPNAVYLVAVSGSAVLGYGGMRSAAGEFYIDNIGVAPAHRRQGAGRAIVTHLIEQAREAGGLFLSLEVRPSNTPAIRMYEQLGFALAGRRRDFYQKPREDGLIYTLTFTKGEDTPC